MWDLIPWLGIEPGALCIGNAVLDTDHQRSPLFRCIIFFAWFYTNSRYSFSQVTTKSSWSLSSLSKVSVFCHRTRNFLPFFLVPTVSLSRNPGNLAILTSLGACYMRNSIHCLEENVLVQEMMERRQREGVESDGEAKKFCGELWKTESEAPRERPLSLLLMFESGLRLSKNEDFKSSIIRKRANWVHKEHIKIRYNPLSHKSTV